MSLYLRQLEHLATRGVEKISSRELSEILQVTDAQVRKDLAHFGQFGRPGVGYRVRELAEQIRRILRTDHLWQVIVVGTGDLGRALLRHKGFLRNGFELVAAFDITQALLGTTVGGVTVRHVRELPEVVRKGAIRLAVVAVPPEAAQAVTDMLCQVGIKGILNFAPANLQTPDDVTVRQVDLAAHLEQLSFQVGASED
jgi:redox-sensing transcriptional repressor